VEFELLLFLRRRRKFFVRPVCTNKRRDDVASYTLGGDASVCGPLTVERPSQFLKQLKKKQIARARRMIVTRLPPSPCKLESKVPFVVRGNASQRVSKDSEQEQISAELHQNLITKATKRSSTARTPRSKREKHRRGGTMKRIKKNRVSNPGRKPVSPKPRFRGCIQLQVFSSRTRLWVCRSRVNAAAERCSMGHTQPPVTHQS